jgi:hypothetical protein
MELLSRVHSISKVGQVIQRTDYITEIYLDNPYGENCYNLSPTDMIAWITDFVNTYHAATTRYGPHIHSQTHIIYSLVFQLPKWIFHNYSYSIQKFILLIVIYTNTPWWQSCTGDSPVFASNSPLWIASYNAVLGQLPAGWS